MNVLLLVFVERVCGFEVANVGWLVVLCLVVECCVCACVIVRYYLFVLLGFVLVVSCDLLCWLVYCLFIVGFIVIL